MFVLFNTIACVVLYAGILAAFLAGQKTLAIVIGCLCCIYGLAALIPGLAVSVRRLHDINKSGWWILISLVPGVGGAHSSHPGLHRRRPRRQSVRPEPQIARTASDGLKPLRLV
jgi:uncharacterized membrane protein YhaH (DUF805 family)